jgi:hypothetical protein
MEVRSKEIPDSVSEVIVKIMNEEWGKWSKQARFTKQFDLVVFILGIVAYSFIVLEQRNYD